MGGAGTVLTAQDSNLNLWCTGFHPYYTMKSGHMLEQRIKERGRLVREENIILKILRLLAEEHLISLEEEAKGKELFQREMVK